MRVASIVWLVNVMAAVGSSGDAHVSGEGALGEAHRQGVMHFRHGDYAAAAEWFARERESNPGNARARAFLALCRESLGDPDRARRAWKDVAAAAGGSRLAVLATVRLKGLEDRLPSAPGTILTVSILSEVDPGWSEVRTEHFVVEAYNRRLASTVAERAEAYLEGIRAQVLGTSLYPHTVRIRVFDDAETYRAHVGAPRWSGGGFRVEPQPNGDLVREVHLIQLGPDGKLNQRLLEVELPHELSHVVVAEFFGQRPCPIWLDEALAMMAEGRHDPARAERVQLAVRFGTYAPFRVLLNGTDWPPDYPMSLLYAQAESVGRFLWSRLGDAAGRDLLTRVRLGESVSAALERVLGTRTEPVLEVLERQWAQQVAAKDVSP